MLSALPLVSDLTDREIFLLFCQCGTLSRVATVLDTHPSKISRAIKHLEHKLDTQLVKRDGKKLLLTREGEHYKDSIITAFRDILEHEYILRNKILKKNLRVFYHTIPGRLFMENVLNDCIRKFPEISFNYEIVSHLTQEHLKDNCLFIGNGRNATIPEDTIRKNIFSDELLIGSSITNPEIEKDRVYAISELYDKKIINSSSCTIEYFDESGKSHNTEFRNILINVGQSVDSIKFGVKNNCLFMTCRYSFERTELAEQIRQVPVKEPIEPYYIDIFYNKNTRDNPESKMVIDYLYREARTFFLELQKTLNT
ncbi:LysR family transcriptional regulator [Acetobacter sp. P5B1]|uniref:LysR family transcriptional regulator n=1 Tax=Acetobacter sp. P5B1 TaxID=2762620 RepID=UPI001C057FE5|nr:LysR family transcriptional regulator [Acetobacter sp. P5B1]